MILNFTWKTIRKLTIPGDLFYFEARIYEIFSFNKILAGLLVECYKCNSLFIYNFNSTILETPLVCIKNNCSSRKFFFKKKKILLMTFTKIKFIKEDFKKNKFLFFDKALIPNFRNSLKIGDKIIIFGMLNVISISNNHNIIENKKNIYSFYFISKKLVLKNKYNTNLGYFKYKEMYFLLRIVRYNDFFFFLVKRSRFNNFPNKILFIYIFFFSLANLSFFKGMVFPKDFFFKFSSSIKNILSYFDAFFFLNFEEKKMRKNNQSINYQKKKHAIILENFSFQNYCETLLSYDNLKSSNQNNCILIFKSKFEKLRSLIQFYPLNFINLNDYFMKNIYSNKKKISNILLSTFKIKKSHFEIKKKKHINITKLALSKYFFKKCVSVFQMQKKPYLTKLAHEFLLHLYSNNIKNTCNGFRHNVVSFVIKLAEIRIKFLFKIFVSLEDILEIIDILSLNNELILKNPIIKLKNFLKI
ncbi:hypothetical protein (nucleomorph) [Guillardia theta]|uniref:MCM OB domain-containing protein n=1 Tax=Guillardia theta TaxID=55529 RepID=Q98RR3_GUITH|nr:hypothetical protein GTHECHR1091 [Guillardia theta]AAK39884.1 hypothetical protein [Guillardia theta]